MAGFEPLRVDGDLFLLGDGGLAALDRLETGSGRPYVRGRIDVVATDGAAYTAQAYPASDPERWRALVARGEADALPTYPRELASDERYKDCCLRAPGHPPPHDVVDPLDSVGR